MKIYRKLGKLFLMLCITSIVALAGCINQDDGVEELPYKNDVITIEEFYVSDSSPYETGATVIDLLLKNNGEFSVSNLEVGFDTPGFCVQNLECDGENIPLIGEQCTTEAKCVFNHDHWLDEIVPFDTRNIVLTLKVMNANLLHPATYTVDYYVEYDYFGMRKMDIPIIDGVTKTRPSSKYGQSSQTYGPISLSFEPPVRGERIEDGKTITEHWGVRDHPFKIEMKFKRVGSSSIGSITDPNIEGGMIRLDLDGLEKASIDDVDLCGEFKKVGNDLHSTKGLDVPGEITCSLKSTTFSDTQYNEPETTGIILATYNYTYRYMNSQDFEIQPLPE